MGHHPWIETLSLATGGTIAGSYSKEDIVLEFDLLQELLRKKPIARGAHGVLSILVHGEAGAGPPNLGICQALNS